MSDVPDRDAVAATLHSVLNSIVATYNAEDIALPDRQYITTGEAAHDCEQLTVSFIQMYIGSPGAEAEQPQKCDAPRTVVMQIQLVRCVPKPSSRGSAPPSAEAITEVTESQMTDVWFLMQGALNSDAADYLGALADVSITPPSGGYQAIQLNFVCAVR